ncbi:MAG: branched-chain-amino-acid transaminase [Pseudomonadota bacterium]|nr:branched-chain-amino-acid transaminase [Pseudomonadota bacterium]
MSAHGVCWLGGQVLPLASAKVSVMDHGLLYGDGVFEGIRFYSARPLLLAAHLRRLENSASAIALTLPWSEQEITSVVSEVIAAYGQPDGYIRLVVTRGVGALGINPASCSNPELIVIADGLRMISAEAREQGVCAVIASTRRLPLDGLDPRVKSLNYLNQILARIEANRAGAEEALMLNAQGRVAEGTADNVFVVRGGELLTPPVTDGALEGITRGVVMQLGREAGLGVREVSLAPYDLYTADECFLTGTGAELIPVREIDGRGMKICPGPVYGMLSRAFADFIVQQTGDF